MVLDERILPKLLEETGMTDLAAFEELLRETKAPDSWKKLVRHIEVDGQVVKDAVYGSKAPESSWCKSGLTIVRDDNKVHMESNAVFDGVFCLNHKSVHDAKTMEPLEGKINLFGLGYRKISCFPEFTQELFNAVLGKDDEEDKCHIELPFWHEIVLM